MIKSASFRICLIDGLPVSESKVFKALLKENVRAAVKMTTRITVSFDEIRAKGSDELNRFIDEIVQYTQPNKRSEAS